MSFKCKSKIIFIFLFLFTFNFYAQNYDIDYYGIVSTEIDSNMSKMTSDLYYTQLSEINNFTVTDKRTGTILTTIPSSDVFSESKLSFYTTISKDSNSDKWIATINVYDKSKQELHSKKKEYDSFYKILMESKNTLKDTIKQLIENESYVTTVNTQVQNENFSNNDNSILSTENLSGTWAGEENIDKIVILRGGRGFVIFKNGASMNISVEINNNEILITQKGRSNASFYTELPRNTALNAALSDTPISWKLKLIDNNNLSGIKNTLLPDGDSYKQGSIKTNWIRIN